MSDFNSTRPVIARKPHPCHECGRAIRPGERYWRIAAVWEGDFFTFVECAHCHHGREVVWAAAPAWWKMSYGGQFTAGEWRDVAVEARSARVWRVVVGNRRQWTRRDGGLMPVTGS